VAEWNWGSAPPNVDNGIGQQHYLAIYKDGVKIWQSHGCLPTILGSTDRWIYFSTEALNVAAFTDGKFYSDFSDISPPGSALEWIVRHDGSELMPIGAILDTKTRVHPYGFLTGSGVGNFLTRDSSRVPYCLPGSYQEMYDQRNDV